MKPRRRRMLSMFKGRNPLACILILLLAAAVAPSGGRRAAAADEPAAAYGAVERERAALADLDLQLVQAAAERDRLAAERRDGERRLAGLERQQAQLRARLAADQRRVDAVVRFLYEDGTVSFLGVLFEARSFSDFVTRADFVRRIVRYDVGVLRGVAETRRQLADAVAAARTQQQALAAQAARLESLVTRLQDLRSRHEAALAGASADLAALDRALLAGLPGLDELLARFAELPWSSLQPDSVDVDFVGRTVTATVREDTLNAFFASQVPQFSGFAFHFGADGAVLDGGGMALSGPASVADGMLRWQPDALTVGGVPAPAEVLAGLLAGRNLTVALAAVAPGLRLVSATTVPGALRLEFAAVSSP